MWTWWVVYTNKETCVGLKGHTLDSEDLSCELLELVKEICAEAATGGILLKKTVLKTFAKFTRKHLCQSLFFNNVAGLSLQLY